MVFSVRRMASISHLTWRNFLIALHDLLTTAAALFAAFYLRFEGGDGFFDRLPLLFQVLPTPSPSAWSCFSSST